jgi:hypothetical protein
LLDRQPFAVLFKNSSNEKTLGDLANESMANEFIIGASSILTTRPLYVNSITTHGKSSIYACFSSFILNASRNLLKTFA